MDQPECRGEGRFDSGKSCNRSSTLTSKFVSHVRREYGAFQIKGIGFNAFISPAFHFYIPHIEIHNPCGICGPQFGRFQLSFYVQRNCAFQIKKILDLKLQFYLAVYVYKCRSVKLKWTISMNRTGTSEFSKLRPFDAYIIYDRCILWSINAVRTLQTFYFRDAQHTLACKTNFTGFRYLCTGFQHPCPI